jgi:lysyl-tRNA synthetase class 2
LEAFELLRNQRIEKLKKLEEMGVQAFPYRFERTHHASEALALFRSDESLSPRVSLSGRIMAIRRMGKASFGHIADPTGRIQFYINQEKAGEKTYQAFKCLDIGDIVGFTGNLFKTKTEEITLMAEEMTVLAKSLRTLPIVKEKVEGDEKVVYDAFADKELRYRQRYVDLVVNADVRSVFVLRSRMVSAMRRFLEGRGFLEVETPVLQPQYGGAFARPFVTHHNALDIDLYMRIADELYLKRLIVGGFDGVFEISKDFRNEGMDKDHNPEFTMLEVYQAFGDLQSMMDLTQGMFVACAEAVNGSLKCNFRDFDIDLTPPWPRVKFNDLL